LAESRKYQPSRHRRRVQRQAISGEPRQQSAQPEHRACRWRLIARRWRLAAGLAVGVEIRDREVEA